MVEWCQGVNQMNHDEWHVNYRINKSEWATNESSHTNKNKVGCVGRFANVLAPRIRPKVDGLRGESAQAKTRRDGLGRPRLSTCRQMRTLGAWHSIEVKWVWTNEKTLCFTTIDISCQNTSDKRWCRLQSHCWWAHARRPIVTNDNRHQQIIDQQSHQLTQVHQHRGLETQQMNEWNERLTTLERNESSFV